MSTKTFIVLCGQVVGGGPFFVEYSFDGRKFDNLANAIDHGATLRRSDDFNIGVLEDGKLIRIDWMSQIVDTDPVLMAKVSKQVGL